MDSIAMSLSKVERLIGKKYQVWLLKVGATLRNHKLFKELIESDKPAQNADEATQENNCLIWEVKNNEAFEIIIITEQVGLCLGETSAKRYGAI